MTRARIQLKPVEPVQIDLARPIKTRRRAIASLRRLEKIDFVTGEGDISDCREILRAFLDHRIACDGAVSDGIAAERAVVNELMPKLLAASSIGGSASTAISRIIVRPAALRALIAELAAYHVPFPAEIAGVVADALRDLADGGSHWLLKRPKRRGRPATTTQKMRMISAVAWLELLRELGEKEFEAVEDVAGCFGVSARDVRHWRAEINRRHLGGLLQIDFHFKSRVLPADMRRHQLDPDDPRVRRARILQLMAADVAMRREQRAQLEAL